MTEALETAEIKIPIVVYFALAGLAIAAIFTVWGCVVVAADVTAREELKEVEEAKPKCLAGTLSDPQYLTDRYLKEFWACGVSSRNSQSRCVKMEPCKGEK